MRHGPSCTHEVEHAKLRHRPDQQGTITRVWAKRGSRPRAPRDRRYEWAYLFGAICPQSRTGAAIIMPEVNVKGGE